MIWQHLGLSSLVDLYEIGQRSGSSSLEDFAKRIGELYFEIPKEDRRYCLGDMDSKDFEILRILHKHNIKEK